MSGFLQTRISVITAAYRKGVIFEAEIFAGEAKFKFWRIKILKITNFKDVVATIIYNYGFINSYAHSNYASSLLKDLGLFRSSQHSFISNLNSSLG